MQTFIVKVIGNGLTARDVEQMIWQSSEFGYDEIIVTET